MPVQEFLDGGCAQDRLVRADTQSDGWVKWAPFDCANILGKCEYYRDTEWPSVGHSGSDYGRYQKSLEKKGDWFYLTTTKYGKNPIKSEYRLGKYNLVAAYRRGNYWEKLVDLKE